VGDQDVRELLLRFGFAHSVLVREPGPDERRRFKITGPVAVEYGRACAPDGEPRDGGKRSVFGDDAGNVLLVVSWSSGGAARCRSWAVLTTEAEEPAPGTKFRERYVVMSKKQAARVAKKSASKPAAKSASKPAKKSAPAAAAKGKGEARHRAAMAAKGKAKPAPKPAPAAAPKKRAATAPAPAPAPAAAAPSPTDHPVIAGPPALRRGKTHCKIFGKHAYCAVSRALGLRGYSTKEATLVFAMLAPAVLPAKGSIGATLRDSRVTPAELSDAEWTKLDKLRELAQKELGAKASLDVRARALELAANG
jgi:hypothetical protein